MAITAYTPRARRPSIAELRERSAQQNVTGRRMERDLQVGGVVHGTEARRVTTMGRFTTEADPADSSLLGSVGTIEYRTAFAAELRGKAGPRERALLAAANREYRDLGVGAGAAGGYAVPQSFLERLTTRTQDVSAMRRLASTVPTQSGSDAPWPLVDDIANVAVIQGENAAVSALDIALTTSTIKTYLYAAGLVKVSQQLLQDAAWGIDVHLADVLGARYGRTQNTHFTVGTGTGQPAGLVPTLRVGVTGATGSTLTVTFASLQALVASVDESYRINGTFMMGDLAWQAVQNMVDSAGRPLWAPSTANGEPHRLLGYPVAINPAMPAPGANNRSIIFGDIARAYIIRPVIGQTSVMRLRERYGDQLQVGYLGWSRVGGMPDDPQAAAAYVHSAT